MSAWNLPPGVETYMIPGNDGSDEKCFACDRPLGKPFTVTTNESFKDEDGEETYYRILVGPECFKRIMKAGDKGYQPPLGGPKLYPMPKSNPAQRGGG